MPKVWKVTVTNHDKWSGPELWKVAYFAHFKEAEAKGFCDKHTDYSNYDNYTSASMELIEVHKATLRAAKQQIAFENAVAKGEIITCTTGVRSSPT